MLLFCPTMHTASGVFLQTLKSNAKKVFLRIANAKIQCEESVPSRTPQNFPVCGTKPLCFPRNFI